MTRMQDFERTDGSIDWSAYQNAQQQSGERCYECGKYLFSGTGIPTSCEGCRELRGPAEAHHHSKVRCPSCGLIAEAYRFSSDDLFEDGKHRVHCPDCDHLFEVETRVSFDFGSPARNPLT